jgi:hypothetical protein
MARLSELTFEVAQGAQGIGKGVRGLDPAIEGGGDARRWQAGACCQCADL